jgi:hypothetical protein
MRGLKNRTFAILLMVSIQCGMVRADAPPNPDVAIARGLSFLARQQNPDGSFDAGAPPVAATGMSLLAFLAAGHTPDVGRYGLNVRNAVDYLLKQNPEDGYFGKIDGSGMYGQGVVTLALAEVYGVESEARRRKIQPALSGAVKQILAAQAVEKPEPFAGGWRMQPDAVDSDLSVSAWNILALRAAQNVGMNVPKPPIDRAVAFALRCFNSEQGAFTFQPGSEPGAALTGVGILNLYLLDASDRPEIAAGASYVVSHPLAADSRYFYYHCFYTTLAAYQVGGTTWPAVWKVTQGQLLPMQQQDGGWPQSATAEEPGRVYATSMAVLTLAVPYRLLPIYQR